MDVGKWIGDIFSVEAMYFDLFVECLKEDKRNMRMRHVYLRDLMCAPISIFIVQQVHSP